MDCRTARLLLDFGRPLAMELEEHDAEALQEHLADCSECGHVAQAERSADHAIGQAMRAVSPPPDFRSQLLARLDRDLRARYRRRWWRVGGGVAVAACLALVLGLMFGWAGRPVTVDPELIAQDMPKPGIAALNRLQAQAFFHAQGFAVSAPREFNYQTLQFLGIEPLEGRKVPFLLFTRGIYQARVYVVKAGQFNLEGTAGAASAYKVEVRTDPGNADVQFLIFYNSESLQLFLSDHRDDGEA